MKIIIATETYFPNVNGASYFSQRLAWYLQKKGHSVLVIAPSRKIIHEKYEHNGVKIFGVRSYPVFINNFRIALPCFIKDKVRREIENFQPDIIHLQGHFFLQKVVFKIAKTRAIPLVATNHFRPENLIHYLPLPHIIIQYLVDREWRKFKEVFENVDVVTTPTATAADLMKEINFSKPIRSISCGIDLNKFFPMQNTGDLREKYKIPRKFTLLYVGRLDKEKNVDFIIKSLKSIKQKADVHLVVVGTGALQNKLKKLTAKLELEDEITFTDFIPNEDLPRIYCLADCFVIAGISELQSIVTLEAMASGLPVMAIKAMALPELARHGVNGFLFEFNNNSLVDGILKIVHDKKLQASMAQASLEIVKEHDINKTIDEFENIYRGLQEKYKLIKNTRQY